VLVQHGRDLGGRGNVGVEDVLVEEEEGLQAQAEDGED
jgi:hypothetical protein